MDTFHVQWHITDYCNLRCTHCYQDGYSRATQLPYLRLKALADNIFEFLRATGRRLTVNLTGGEPLLHPDWERLLAYLRESRLVKETGIITNGFFLSDEILVRLAGYRGLTLKISAEGFTEESYELFRGKGTFAKFAALTARLDRTPQRKTIMFTLCAHNVDQVPALFPFAREHGFDSFIVERFVPWGRGNAIRALVVDADGWRRTLTALAENCGFDRDISGLLPYTAFQVKCRKNRFELFGAPCVVGRDGMALMPDGTVYPCRRFPLAIGNLQTTPLKSIWDTSPVLAAAAQCPGCRAMAYALTGNYLAEDPLNDECGM